MKFHPYGQPYLVQLTEGTTAEDLRSLAHFNRIIRNYLLMCGIERRKRPGRNKARATREREPFANASDSLSFREK